MCGSRCGLIGKIILQEFRSFPYFEISMSLPGLYWMMKISLSVEYYFLSFQGDVEVEASRSDSILSVEVACCNNVWFAVWSHC